MLLLAGCQMIETGRFEVQSPDGNLRVEVSLNEEGQPFYQTYYQGEMVLDTSLLGLDLSQADDLISNFEVIGTARNEVDETWEQPWGEEQFIRNHHRELRVELREKTDLERRLDIVFRVFDDGVGFRYEFPEQSGLRHLAIQNERTEFNLAGDFGAWWIPAFEDNRYEYLYERTAASEMGKVHTPVTFEAHEQLYLSIHEAALHDYSSMVIDANGGTRLQSELVPYSQGEESRAFLNVPGHSPWRTIQVAQTPGDLITSYLVLNLNEPNQLGDVSWVKPGKYVGVWWEMHIGAGTWAPGEQHAANTANVKRYIDFAAEHGFDGVLVEGWNEGWEGDWTANGSAFSFTQPYPDFELDKLSEYAAEREVYLVGHHETAGFVDNYEQQMADAFQLMDSHGMRAVKTGYVEHGNLLSNGKYHHGQAYVEHFQRVIRLAAQHQIAVVAHEPIKDTGERRTFPNIISREGARGQEFNAWSPDGGNPPNHECILPFTRSLAGPLDFTPGVFDLSIPNKPSNRVNTTLAKQLALYVTIYSPMQMACDLPEHYERYPDAFAFIKEVGVDWETTRVLDGAIGEHLTVARKERGTDNWFLGSITNETPREVTLDFDFLDPGQLYYAKIYRDGEQAHYETNPEDYTVETRYFQRGDSLTCQLAAGGGLAISLLAVEAEITSNAN